MCFYFTSNDEFKNLNLKFEFEFKNIFKRAFVEEEKYLQEKVPLKYMFLKWVCLIDSKCQISTVAERIMRKLKKLFQDILDKAPL